MLCSLIKHAVSANQSVRYVETLLQLSFTYSGSCVVQFISLSLHTVIKLKDIEIVTSAVYSIAIKSIFARAVIGSPGVVTHSIITTVVCFVGTLVNIWNNKRNLTGKRLIEMMCLQNVSLWHRVSHLLLFYFLTYKSHQVTFDNLGPLQTPLQTPLHSCAEPNWWVKHGRRAVFESVWFGRLGLVRQTT